MKELSIEEKAKRYDEAIEKFEVVLNLSTVKESGTIFADDVRKILPELKESEDEDIRKTLINIVKGACDKYGIKYQGEKITEEKLLAWLEKQGEKPVDKLKVSDELYEYIRNTCACIDDALSSETLVDINDYLSMAEHNAQSAFDMIEQQGEQNPIDYPLAHEKMETERWKQACKAACCDRNYRSHYGLTETRDDYFVDGVHWADEHPKQNPADKAEPKFKVGDWIMSNVSHEDYRICKILKIENGEYVIESIYGYKGHNNFETFDKDYHLWTIQDAKDGDVLFSSGHNLLWLHKDEETCHVCINLNYNESISIETDFVTPSDVSPSTKEQSDLLFSKMKELGYEWDAEKKEPKKIEQTPDWSEEDEEMFVKIGEAIDSYYAPFSNDAENMSNWFKSLKDRYAWKPSDKQMNALDSTLQYSQVSHNSFEYLNSLFNDLKRLLKI